MGNTSYIKLIEQTGNISCDEMLRVSNCGIGFIALLINCHGTGTAALASYKAENRKLDTQPPFCFVTVFLQVDYLKLTSLGVEL